MTDQLSLTLESRTWGGKREGAGRKRDKARHDPSHDARDAVVQRLPEHVVMRVLPDVPRLRTPSMILVIADALGRARRDGFRVVHLSAQHNHLHLIVEADNATARARGMQRLASTLAKSINHATLRHGSVFEHRYHATQIGTPTQMHHALAYVLCNWRHHHEDRSCAAARAAIFDPYSSALRFPGWTNSGAAFDPEFPVDEPHTWMLREGWKRIGNIDPFSVPG